MAYGGIRATAGVGARASVGVGPNSDPGVMPGAAGTGSTQPSSPYSTLTPASGVVAPASSHMLMLLVVAEALALVFLRRGFKHHHGG